MYSEPVPKPGNRECCSRNGIRCKNILGYTAGLTLTPVCVAAAGLLVVRWAWVRGYQRLTPELSEYKGSIGSCPRVLHVSFICLPGFSLALDSSGRLRSGREGIWGQWSWCIGLMFLRVGGGVQDRDAALARQRELLSEVSQLRSQLDLMRSTCDQLCLNTRSPDRDDKVRRTSVEGRGWRPRGQGQKSECWGEIRWRPRRPGTRLEERVLRREDEDHEDKVRRASVEEWGRRPWGPWVQGQKNECWGERGWWIASFEGEDGGDVVGWVRDGWTEKTFHP